MSDSSNEFATVLPWQADQWQSLRSQIDADRLPHALLLSGLPGTGRLQFALATRNYLLCERAADHACGRCRACTLLAAQTHADYVAVQPLEAGKAIRVDQIRELSQFVVQTAQRNGRKVVLLNPADSLNINAANALLKSLEEPSADTHFLLLCSVPKRLPPTIRSRCQALVLQAPAPDEALAWLSRQLGDEGEARRRLRFMQNRPCAALRTNAEQSQIQQSVSAGAHAVAQSCAAMPAVAEQWSKLPLQAVLEYLLILLADALRFAMTNGSMVEVDADERAALTRFNQQVPVAALLAVYAEAQDLLVKLHRGGNPNKQLAVEAVLLKFNTV